MKKLTFLQIDAFTTKPYQGNPCAVVLEAGSLSTAAMQAIASEMNLSETAFVMSSESADFRARYFTPAEEIPLAGHPTIATIFALIKTGIVRLRNGQKIFLELEAGIVPVEISHDQNGRLLINMTQLRPRFMREYHAAEVLPAFGLQEGDAIKDIPIMTVSTSTPQLIIPLNSLEALKEARLVIDLYTDLHARGDFFSPHLFVLEGFTERGATFARHFGMPPDTYEDPFTGSATGGMAAYLWHHHLIDHPKFIAEQGHFMRRPGEALVEVVGSHDAIESVKVGGNAVEVLKGELIIPPDGESG